MTPPPSPTQENDATKQSFTVAAPQITLPKGGGAIRGIGEKFAANPATGTGSISVPIATSPGRSGFGPTLSLSYDSGAGNGPYGFGWSLSLPQITRKTDKGLPRYRDEIESDVFILSGSEDLVRQLGDDGKPVQDTTTAPGYTIYRYLPRIEGLFARIERWTRDNGDTHWRSFSRDNILTIYGKDTSSRIAEHNDDPAEPARVFSWLISETRDDRGNAIVYEYKPEDGVRARLEGAHQLNRGNRDDKRRNVNRYLKRIRYGNRKSLLDPITGLRPPQLSDAQINDACWMFEVVLDYGEHDADVPLPDDKGEWDHRLDAFSLYRSGFEVRTARLCKRFLMFHHFAGQKNIDGVEDVGDNCLVRSTDLTYTQSENGYAFVQSVTQSGYVRKGGGYLKRSLPPVEYEYSQATVQDTVHEVDPASLQSLPIGLDGTSYQMVDLHGEGIPGILTEQAGAWFYQRNISPISTRPVEFAPLECVGVKPHATRSAQFMDLAGDGQMDLVDFGGPTAGFYEHDENEGWEPLRPFISRLNRDVRDPNARFIDLNGDGHADLLVTEDDASFLWYPSLGEEGFADAERSQQGLDEEKAPRLVFADGTDTIHLADMSGDGLVDLVRIRNSEICYWPNLGYGRFGAKITMDRPAAASTACFDDPDMFDPKRLRLADIDGSGTTDVIYLHRDGTRLYFNESGNSLGTPTTLRAFPFVDNVAAVTTLDLRGNGTACLVWSSPLPRDSGRQVRYVALMGDTKPHLLTKVANNLGAETTVTYAPSIKFYLADKAAGRPWATKLPFPVHVIERVEIRDAITGNRFITRYSYHDGYFDGDEREFRGFGMVEQWDTDEFAALTADGQLAEPATNFDATSHVPPALTKTWFHTGAFSKDRKISLQHAHRYFGAPTDAAAFDTWEATQLLPDTVLPQDGLRQLTTEERKQAARSLKGTMLRQEIYAVDGTDRNDIPYTVVEQNFTVETVQRMLGNRHAVFFTHPREAITYNYERNPADPRISHTAVLEVDQYGSVLRSLSIAYPRAAEGNRHLEQAQTHLILTASRVAHRDTDQDSYRIGVPVETCTYEVVKPPEPERGGRFTFDTLAPLIGALAPVTEHYPDPKLTIPYPQWDWRRTWNSATQPGGLQVVDGKLAPKHTRLRLIEHTRTRYRADDLTTMLQLGTVQTQALQGESYKLALTPQLIDRVFVRTPLGAPVEDLLPIPADILEGQGLDQGGYIQWDQGWWIPSGRTFFDADADVTNPAATAAIEVQTARDNFYQPVRFTDPFGHSTWIEIDRPNRLLVVGSRDALGNTVSVNNDYRTLQPNLITDPNGNRSSAVYDALGLVVATAMMGKEGENVGDLLDDVRPDLELHEIQRFVANPRDHAKLLLGHAATRIAYDLDRYERCGQPPFAATLARETHLRDPGGADTKIRISVSYSDGFGREIQSKIQAEPGDANIRQDPSVLAGGDIAPGQLIRNPDQTLKTPEKVDRRWVGTGRTAYNNKGKPVRKFESFFSSTHLYEPEPEMTDTGVSTTLFYDPLSRVIATLHPDHSYDKVVFNPWQQTIHDRNDTLVARDGETGDPRTDPDIGGFVRRYFTARPKFWTTWHSLRINKPDVGPGQPNPARIAAQKAASHADTPTTVHLDTIGRPFLTVTVNRVVCTGHSLNGKPDEQVATRSELDIEGNERSVRDAKQKTRDAQGEEITDEFGRTVMRYSYDMLGNRIHQLSIDAGDRWTLNDSLGKQIRAWDTRNHIVRTEYDPLRRPVRIFVTGADPAKPLQEILTERSVYGEQHPDAEAFNLRGVPYLHLDQAGAATTVTRDFKGNILRAGRRLTNGTQYRHTMDWHGVDSALPASASAVLDPDAIEAKLSIVLEPDTYVKATTYDAFNRPVEQTTPHTPAMQPSTIRAGFNEAGFLEAVALNMNGDTQDGVPVWTQFVQNINYDAKGQRERIDYGNDVSTVYQYDPLTYRLTSMVTNRTKAKFPTDDPQPPLPDWPGSQVQNLNYTYDPVGNITHIRDDAQQRIFFHNRRIEPSASYTYDATYRLIQATGREHLGQIGGKPIPHSHDDAPRVGMTLSPDDDKAMGTYTERYVYDAVGNFIEMKHSGDIPANSGWTRSYAYNEPSLIENGSAPGTSVKMSNRISSTTIDNTKAPLTEPYIYDAHGNMNRMPQLGGGTPSPNMFWDYRDQFTCADLGGGGAVYYVYDSNGRRIRKISEKSATLIEEHIYLGGFEIFRKRQGAARIERETLHVMDDDRRIAIIETRTLDTAGNDKAPRQLIRYQHANHLGSASLELDPQAKVISYEEYAPYGSSTYQASTPETPKRYRYTGKERDEETGFTYHGARYYAPWLGRWTSCDPKSPASDINAYAYARSAPTTFNDPDGREPQKAQTAPSGNKVITDESRIVIYNPDGSIKHVIEEKRVPARSGELKLNIAEKIVRKPTPKETEEFLKDARQLRAIAEKESSGPKESAKDANMTTFSNPMPNVARNQGRGAGPSAAGGHGLADDPTTKDWATRGAKDIMAPVGTPVQAATEGTVEWITFDTRDKHSGKIFGDQITIRSADGSVKTFYTHIDIDPALKQQWLDRGNKEPLHVTRGQVLGHVTTWADSPNGTHLHFGMASRRRDGSYRGIDPDPLLEASKGSHAAFDVQVNDDGSYQAQSGTGNATVTAPPLETDKGSGRIQDMDDIHPRVITPIH